MFPPLYPPGTVRSLINSDAVTPATAKALTDRLQMRATPVFFEETDYHLLSIICDRLLDQSPENRMVNIAAFIDERLAKGRSGGWRFDHMPPDYEMYRKGLKGLDETAGVLYSVTFNQLTTNEQNAVLQALQEGTARGIIWEEMSSVTFFEELLAEATEIFYAHPLAQEEIGYAGMADAYGWQKIGLNEREAIEPKEQQGHA
jgi:gluconate 2-dehydrogenase gamma chain